MAYVVAALADRFQTKVAATQLSDSGQVSRWRRPEQGVLKVNTDGAFDSKTGTGGWGFIIRDDRGDMIQAGAGGEEFLQNAFHAELLGCLAGLKAVASLGISRVVLETDASLVKVAVEGDEYRLSVLGGIVS